MENANLIRLEKEHSRTFYHLTEEGAETIQFFQNKISPTIQDEIDTFLQEKHYELKTLSLCVQTTTEMIIMNFLFAAKSRKITVL